MKLTGWIALAACCGVLLGCASLRGVEGFKPGAATIDQVRAREKPAAEWTNADGTQTLEYDARPDSGQNLMLDFDAKGRLAAVRPVLTLENMALLKIGMRRAEVKRILGNPRTVWRDGVSGGEFWEWPLEPANELGRNTIQVLIHPTADGVMRIQKIIRFD